jgi:hypothetical protein
MSRFRVRLTTADGRIRHWVKAGQIHSLDERLAPIWIANFKPAMFQVADDGQLVPRGTPGAVDVVAWDLEEVVI